MEESGFTTYQVRWFGFTIGELSCRPSFTGDSVILRSNFATETKKLMTGMMTWCHWGASGRVILCVHLDYCQMSAFIRRPAETRVAIWPLGSRRKAFETSQIKAFEIKNTNTFTHPGISWGHKGSNYSVAQSAISGFFFFSPSINVLELY